MKTAETPAGIFTINKVKIPSAYTCAAEQKIEYISENHMQIITMDQAVSFGDQILSPRICQSCMNPEHIYEGAAQPLSRHKKWSCRTADQIRPLCDSSLLLHKNMKTLASQALARVFRCA